MVMRKLAWYLQSTSLWESLYDIYIIPVNEKVIVISAEYLVMRKWAYILSEEYFVMINWVCYLQNWSIWIKITYILTFVWKTFFLDLLIVSLETLVHVRSNCNRWFLIACFDYLQRCLLWYYSWVRTPQHLICIGMSERQLLLPLGHQATYRTRWTALNSLRI